MKRLYLYILLLVAVLALMAALRLCVPAGSAPVPAHSGGDTIDVAIEYSPTYCYTYADTLGGFHYDMMRSVARKLRRPVKFHPLVSVQKAIADLNAGAFDIVIMQYPMTKENLEFLEFTNPVSLDRQILVQRKDSTGAVPAASQLSLARDTVWVVKDSPMKSRIQDLSHEIGDTIFVREDSAYGPEQLFLRVAAGEIKFAVINESIARSLAQEYPLVDFSTGISFTQYQPWICRKGNTALRDSLNKYIEPLR